MNKTLWINERFIIPIYWDGETSNCNISATEIIDASKKNQKPIMMLHNRKNSDEQLIIISDISYSPNDNSVYGLYLFETNDFISVSIIDYNGETTCHVNESNLGLTIDEGLKDNILRTAFPVGSILNCFDSDPNEYLLGTWDVDTVILNYQTSQIPFVIDASILTENSSITFNSAHNIQVYQVSGTIVFLNDISNVWQTIGRIENSPLTGVTSGTYTLISNNGVSARFRTYIQDGSLVIQVHKNESPLTNEEFPISFFKRYLNQHVSQNYIGNTFYRRVQ